MKTSVLASGSGGNVIYITHGLTAILIDAGLSPEAIDKRLVKAGIVGHSQITAVFLTHATHTDHVAYAAKISAKWRIPVYGLDNWKSALLTIPGMTVGAFAVPHDDPGACGYVITENGEEGRSIGVVMDAGMISHEMAVHLRGCEVLILGCDYEPAMLEANQEYSRELKDRIASNTGHLGTNQCATFLRDQWDGRAHTIVLSHLSWVNNSPERALGAVAEALRSRFRDVFVNPTWVTAADGPGARAVTIIVSTQDQPTTLISV